MKKLLIVLAIYSMSYALQAPYLISTTALSDSSVGLAWRNNDVATTGFIVQRKDSTGTNYKFLDSVKSATILSYMDMKGLQPATLYTYQVIAYSATEVSDTSNSSKVTTPRTAPILTSATALSRNRVNIGWSDKSKAMGFIIQRKDSTETIYQFIDSIKSAGTFTYTDTIGLQSGTIYTYRVIAYDAMNVQDTSNTVQVTTKPDIFNRPNISVSWNFENPSSVQITITDSSNCEIGYRIYRSNGFNSSFNPVATILSTRPDSMGAIIGKDNTIASNKWYTYKVAVYKTDSSIFSDSISTYTLQSVPMSTKVIFQKLSDIPISLAGLSAKAGDSIILKEAPSPAGKYTVINVNNPMLPKFDGYIDSAVLLSYPQQTLIPAFLRFGVYNGLSLAHVIHYKNRMLILQGNGVDMYQIQNNNLVFVDTFMLPSTMPISQMLLLNDSLLAVVADSSFSSNSIFGYGSSISGRHSYMYSFQLANSGFSSFPAYTVPENNYHSFGQGPTSSYWNSDSSGYSYIRGFYNDGILISIKQFNSSASRNGGGTSTSSRDSSASVAVVNGNLGMVYSRSNPNAGWFDSSTSNTGHYLSPTENLCSAGPALFVSDIRDLSDGYHTALANNAVYQDSAAGAPRNILLDTLHKMAYLFYDSKLSILTYQRQIVGVANQSNKPSGLKNISIVPNASRSGVTIVLPAASYNADLFIYDLSGRVVDKIRRITSNAVFWRPKSKSMNFYIVVVKSGKEQYLSKFIVR